MTRVTWGILSTAKIGLEKVIPAMQRSEHGQVVALASRQEDKAKAVAQALGLIKSYGSYEALLAAISTIHSGAPSP